MDEAPQVDWLQVGGCFLIGLIGMAGLLLLARLALADEPLAISDQPAVEPFFAEPPVGKVGEASLAPTQEEETMPEPGWMSWCAEQGVPESSIDAIDAVIGGDLLWLMKPQSNDAAAAKQANYEPEALVALLWVESRCRHWDDFSIRRGDSGRAIGIGQIHEDPWGGHLRKLWGPQVDLRRLDDNVAAAAYLLFERGGWLAGDEQAQLRALTYYNTGRHDTLPNGYAKKVHAVYRAIKAQGLSKLSDVRAPAGGEFPAGGHVSVEPLAIMPPGATIEVDVGPLTCDDAVQALRNALQQQADEIEQALNPEVLR